MVKTEYENRSGKEFTEKELSLVRSEMLQALTITTEHIKYTINLCSTVFAAGVALVSYAIQEFGGPDETIIFIETIILIVLNIFACVCFGGVVFLSKNSIKIVERYYVTYSDSYIYSARLHITANHPVKHDWYVDLQKMIGDPMCPDASERFMKPRNKGENHSWFYYERIIKGFSLIGWIGIIASPIITCCILISRI